ncbi:MAG: hypothetical protein U1C46_03315 [Bacteroidales bacterium]|nr:hypothetical protein [Bacteroidales bacterium]MDZ4203829.1 hypothetical protein [Bacteroidales bacterium]
MKTVDDDKTKNLFGAAFSNFGETPPNEVWEGVVSGLQRRKRMILWRRVAAAASILLLLALPAWFLLNRQEQNVELAQESTTIDAATAVISPGNDAFPLAAEAALSPAAHEIATNQVTTPAGVIKHYQLLGNKKLEAEKLPGWNINTDIFAAEQALPVPVQDITNIGLPETQDTTALTESATAPPQPLKITKELPATDSRIPDLVQEDFVVKPTDEKPWQLAMGYGTIQGLSMSRSEPLFSPNKATFDLNSYTTNLSNETGDFSDIENTTHNQPLTIGIAVSRQLGKRWHVEGGLLFTRLGSSSKTYLDDERYSEYKNQLLYVGFPASVRYNMLNGKRFFVYFAQGVVFEKGLTANYQNNRFNNDRLDGSVSGSFDVQGFQFSTLTSLGAGLNLSKTLSIYLQPGAQVFFLNKTQPFNIRSSQPAWPALQTGLRVQL